MLESNLEVINNDTNKLAKDAQALFQAAAALSGEKAEEMRIRAVNLLEAAMARAQDAQTNAIVAGKKMAASADGYVKENPWRTVAVAAGMGLLTGVILGRK